MSTWKLSVAFFGNSLFKDIIKWRVLRQDHPGLMVTSKPNDKCPYKRKAKAFCDLETHGENGNQKTEWRLELCSPKTRNPWSHQKLEEARKDFQVSLEEAEPYLNLDFRFLASKTVREYICVVLNHQFGGNLLKQSQERNTEVILLSLPLSCWLVMKAEISRSNMRPKTSLENESQAQQSNPAWTMGTDHL